jgi:hypothetical protein
MELYPEDENFLKKLDAQKNPERMEMKIITENDYVEVSGLEDLFKSDCVLFERVIVLNLLKSYEMTFTLREDKSLFEDLCILITLYEAPNDLIILSQVDCKSICIYSGEDKPAAFTYLYTHPLQGERNGSITLDPKIRSVKIDPGEYDVHVKICYQIKEDILKTTRTVKVDIDYKELN